MLLLLLLLPLCTFRAEYKARDAKDLNVGVICCELHVGEPWCLRCR